MKRTLRALTLIVSVLAFASFAQAADRISIATGGTAGTYFPLGGALAQAASKSGALKATAETSNASVANINLIGARDIEMALVQNDVAFWAMNGMNMFNGKPVKNMMAVLALYPEEVQLVITKKSGIKTINDLKGKRVSVGAPGSGTEADVQAIFQVAGLTYKDLGAADRLDYATTASRFKDEQIDAGFLVTGYPSPAIMDIATTKDITLLSFDKDFLAKLNKAYPYFVPATIPAGTYNGIDTPIAVPAVMGIVVTHDKMSDKVVYEFLKGVFDNLPDVHAAHAKGKNITLESALNGLTVPLHPGAAKFYKEKGLKVQYV